MEGTLKELITERGHIKAAVTRFKTFYDTKGKSSPIATVQERLDKVSPLYDRFDGIQCQIETLVSGSANEQAQNAERDSFETMYFDLIGEVKTYFASKTSQAVSSQSTLSNASTVNSPVLHEPSNSNIRLPTITLPNFDGSYDNWLKFRDTFESLIHSNTSLSEIQKFHYLDSALKGDAARVIQSLGVSSANYVIAWRCLKDRYENPKALIHHHVNALFELPVIVKDSHLLLRRLIDDSTNHLLSLKTLDEPTDHWDTIIIHLLSTKLDAITKREWERRLLKLPGKPRLTELYEYLEEHCKYLERTVSIKQSIPHQLKSGTTFRKPIERVVANVATNRPTCGHCKGKHFLYACETFKKLSPAARVDEIRKLKYCFNCLQPGHRNMACTRGTCTRCNKRHHTLLHLPKGTLSTGTSATDTPIAPKNTEAPERTTTCTVHARSDDQQHVLLSTAIVHLLDRKGQKHKCRALLDSGSQSHFLRKDFCKKLGLQCDNTKISISGIGFAEQNVLTKTRVCLSSRSGGYNAIIDCLIIPTITEYQPHRQLAAASMSIPENITLADPDFARPGKIDMLIGAGLFWELLCVGQYKPGPDYPLFQKTLLGWIIAGPISVPLNREDNRTTCNLATNRELQEQIANFWRVEDMESISKIPSLDKNDKCERHYERTTTRNKDGRFMVSIPWTEDLDKLGNSREQAYKRLLSLERKLQRHPELRTEYLRFMEEYEFLGHMKETSDHESGYYLPHHAVIKADSTTTKVRVVFDGSAKTTTELSLNDVQYVGPIVQQDLFSILIRFRQHRYVLSGDIAKMYRQILVKPDECKFQKILWRTDSSLPVKTYELKTVTYGTASASFLATRTLRQIGEDIQDTNPTVSRTIIRDFYVDDLLTGTASIEDALKLKVELTTTLAAAGFELRKWTSNEPQIVNSEGTTNLKLPTEGNQYPKTLGVNWTTTEDELRYSVRQPGQHRITKRSILSEIAQIFDPLGLVGPVTILAKIIMQRLWQLDIGWDETLPQNMHTVWMAFRNDLDQINQSRIPRRITCNDAIVSELHGFCDASEKAYGACVYLRTINSHGYCTVRLVCAKSRVAPLKTISLPRLELCGALLLAQLMHKVKTALDLEIHKEYHWCDSTITLTWIQASPNKWQTFVANRTTEIQRLSPSNWKHVPSTGNPADIISRGVNPSVLRSCDMWWNGPAWLSQSENEWPCNVIQVSDVPEQRQTQTVLVNNIMDSSIIDRYSSLIKLLRVVAYCLRFIFNIKTTLRHQNSTTEGSRIGPLLATEIKDARNKLIKMAQAECFTSEIRDLKRGQGVSRTSSIRSLNPFLDETELIRVGGRLSNAPIPYEQRHPIILPAKHKLTTLIIRNEHQRLLHAGCQAVMASLRKTYWPISCKALVKREIKQCVRCFRAKPLIPQHIMGDLPAARVTATRPFHTCGVDYAGPFLIKEKTRSRVVLKSYLCVFVCFATRAIHLELAVDLSTDAFLNCLHRFIARRGKPGAIYSDNGTNFIGAKNELIELGQLLTNKEHVSRVSDHLSQDNIQWHMIPPHAPHFGGLWESAVKSAKYHLRRVIGETRLTFEELYTLLAQVEACLNSRPLTPLSEDPNDLTPLTPGHFLIGDSMTSAPQPDFMHVSSNRLNRYEHLRKMFQDFWQRWHVEYLHQLQQRSKWKQSAPSNIRVGALVLLKDENLPPMRWKLGRITDLHPGKDNVTRVVSVQVVDGIFKRPVAKVCVLPVDTEDTITTQAPHNQPFNQDAVEQVNQQCLSGQ